MLIKNGLLVKLDGVVSGDIRVLDGKIAEIGENSKNLMICAFGAVQEVATTEVVPLSKWKVNAFSNANFVQSIKSDA